MLQDLGKLQYFQNNTFTNVPAALSAKNITDYKKIPYSMFVDWVLLVKANKNRNTPYYNMLSREKIEELKIHIRNYQIANDVKNN